MCNYRFFNHLSPKTSKKIDKKKEYPLPPGAAGNFIVSSMSTLFINMR